MQHLQPTCGSAVQYTAVRQDAGAPLRAVTVRDAIADLPAITNGSSVGEMAYTGAPVSAFQHSIRGGATVLRDHICKVRCPGPEPCQQALPALQTIIQSVWQPVT